MNYINSLYYKEDGSSYDSNNHNHLIFIPYDTSSVFNKKRGTDKFARVVICDVIIPWPIVSREKVTNQRVWKTKCRRNGSPALEAIFHHSVNCWLWRWKYTTVLLPTFTSFSCAHLWIHQVWIISIVVKVINLHFKALSSARDPKDLYGFVRNV